MSGGSLLVSDGQLGLVVVSSGRRETILSNEHGSNLLNYFIAGCLTTEMYIYSSQAITQRTASYVRLRNSELGVAGADMLCNPRFRVIRENSINIK